MINVRLNILKEELEKLALRYDLDGKRVKIERAIEDVQALLSSETLQEIRRDLNSLPFTPKYNGRPAQNDVERAIAITAILLVIGWSPTLIPLHFVLRALGREGFYHDKKIDINFFESFKKRN